MIMEELEKIVKNRKIDTKKLISYGFEFKENVYEYRVNIKNDEFEVIIKIDREGVMTSKVIELAFGDEYTLVNVEGAVGEFVGQVRKEYIDVISDIYDKCSIVEVFKSDYAKKIIEYIYEKYEGVPEFLWDKYEGTAVFRHKETLKWYGVLMTLKRSKLGLSSDDFVDIIDLKIEPEKLEEIVDNKLYFRGYHMNKKHWVTIMLDGSVDINEILKFVDNSFNIK